MSHYSKHFSKKVVNGLKAKGIEIVGAQAVPAFDGDVYFQGTAYVLNDNGTARLRTYLEVEKIANGQE